MFNGAIASSAKSLSETMAVLDEQRKEQRNREDRQLAAMELILIRHSKNNIRNTCGKFDRKCFFMDRSNPVFFIANF